MIRVTVELVPIGNEAQKKVIGVMHIANDASGTSSEGNYKVKLMNTTGQQREFKAINIDRVQGIFGFLADIFRVRDAKNIKDTSNV